MKVKTLRAMKLFAKYVLPGILTAAIVAGGGLAYRTMTREETGVRGGWWPSRPVTYRCDSQDSCLGADHVVFNSVVNLPSYGDERAFVDARMAHAPRMENTDPLRVAPGDRVIIRAYIDNNANPNRIGTGTGVAMGTEVKFIVPDQEADDQLIWGLISADNADPHTVGDTVRLIGDQPFSLSYIESSARLVNSVFEVGFALSSSVISDGAEIGIKEATGHFCCQLNGRYPPCDPTKSGCQVFESLVEIELRVTNPDTPSGIARAGIRHPMVSNHS